MTARLIAFPGVTLTARETETPDPPPKPVTTTPCPVCAYPIRSDEHDIAECRRCHTDYHPPCFWRGLPVAEWVAFWTWFDSEFDSDGADHGSAWDYLCAACRLAGR